jgi:3-phosphoshikimate 1-carboxyvinyltransferase
MDFIAHPGGVLHGKLRVPGDKSISHRAIMLGAIATGTTHITGLLEGDDVLATANAMRTMGVKIDGPKHGRATVHGVGLKGLKAPTAALDLGNSGTSMRLLAGLLAGQDFSVTLTGDASLSRRPMERIATPLRQMEVDLHTAANGRPPLTINGHGTVKPIHYNLPIPSAQVKSCVLLAALYADGDTVVTEPAPTRDHTERMLTGFGYPIGVSGRTITLRGGGVLTATTIDVPADISSAAFFIVAATLIPGSDITLQHVGVNPTRIGVITILQMMGADIHLHNHREIGGEPVADIHVRHAPLQGIIIPSEQVPLAIDEFPVLFVAAAYASGTTVLKDAQELRVKESDRIQVMADGLQALGVNAEPTADGMIIQGLSGAGQGGVVASGGDHRIAMAFTVIAQRAQAPVTIKDCDNVATSFPNFITVAKKVGMVLEQITHH